MWMTMKTWTIRIIKSVSLQFSKCSKYFGQSCIQNIRFKSITQVRNVNKESKYTCIKLHKSKVFKCFAINRYFGFF